MKLFQLDMRVRHVAEKIVQIWDFVYVKNLVFREEKDTNYVEVYMRRVMQLLVHLESKCLAVRYTW